MIDCFLASFIDHCSTSPVNTTKKSCSYYYYRTAKQFSEIYFETVIAKINSCQSKISRKSSRERFWAIFKELRFQPLLTLLLPYYLQDLRLTSKPLTFYPLSMINFKQKIKNFVCLVAKLDWKKRRTDMVYISKGLCRLMSPMIKVF